MILPSTEERRNTFKRSIEINMKKLKKAEKDGDVEKVKELKKLISEARAALGPDSFPHIKY